MSLLQSLTDHVLERLNERQRFVIERRYGLSKGTPQTLEAIGKEAKLTRERIRQIENSSLAVLRGDETKNIFTPVIELASKHLDMVGGVRQENVFFDELIHLLGEEDQKRELSDSILNFAFLLAGSPKQLGEDKKFYPARYLRDADLSKAKDLIAHIEKISKKIGEPVDETRFFETLSVAMKLSNIGNEAIASGYLGISKKFKFSPYGDFGMSHWPEIAPKSMREKAFLVLKKEGSPLHFTTISGHINQMRFDSKSAYPQTVHNELIKDMRFVLCGRGMYGLRSWGLEPGTVKEVIARVLKKSGPLTSQQVIELVKTQRHVKETTIILGLQDREMFHRLDDGKYRTRLA